MEKKINKLVHWIYRVTGFVTNRTMKKTLTDMQSVYDTLEGFLSIDHIRNASIFVIENGGGFPNIYKKLYATALYEADSTDTDQEKLQLKQVWNRKPVDREFIQLLTIACVSGSYAMLTKSKTSDEFSSRYSDNGFSQIVCFNLMSNNMQMFVLVLGLTSEQPISKLSTVSMRVSQLRQLFQN